MTAALADPAPTGTDAVPRWARRVGPAIGLAAGIVVLGPALLPGYTLSYDMVFGPDQPITVATLGLDGSVPRAVPNDLLVALLSVLLPGDVVQKGLLLAVFVLGAWGAARLARSALGAAVSALLYVWNPYVLERLVIGHWGFLLGLAILPWAVAAAADARSGKACGGPRLAAWVLAGALAGSTSGLLVAGTALVVACWPGPEAAVGRGRRGLLVVAVALAANAPWWLPSMLRPQGISADPAGVEAFAAGADTPLGVWGSVATLGGMWNPATWPAERAHALLAVAVLVAVAACVVLGLPALLRLRAGAGAGLATAGLVSFVVAVAGTVPGLRSLLSWAVVHVPGAGLLRDGQKWVAPAVLVVALCAGLTVERLWHPAATRAVGVALTLVPVVALPTLAWGVHGRLTSVPYPDEWRQVAQVVAREADGDVASFPWTYYRRFDWNGRRIVLDPMPRLLPRVVVVNDDLPLMDVTIRGEDPRADRISAALTSNADLRTALAAEGIDVVVVHLPSTGAAEIRSRLAGSPVLHEGAELLVLDVGPVTSRPRRAPAAAALGWVALVVAGIGVATSRIRCRRAGRLLT